MEIKLPFQKETSEKLLQLAAQNNISLEGYLSWLAEKEGPCLLGKKALQENNIALYKQACQQEEQALLQHIFNAGVIYAQLTSNDLGIEDALKHMESMCVPAAVYLLFAGEGYEAKRFEKRAVAYCRMYPSVIDVLPEPYNEIGKALIHDPTR